MKIKRLCLLMLYMASTVTALTYSASGQSNLWSNAASWSGKSLPGSQDSVVIDFSSTCGALTPVLVVDVPATIASLTLSSASSPCTTVVEVRSTLTVTTLVVNAGARLHLTGATVTATSVTCSGVISGSGTVSSPGTVTLTGAELQPGLNGHGACERCEPMNTALPASSSANSLGDLVFQAPTVSCNAVAIRVRFSSAATGSPTNPPGRTSNFDTVSFTGTVSFDTQPSSMVYYFDSSTDITTGKLLTWGTKAGASTIGGIKQSPQSMYPSMVACTNSVCSACIAGTALDCPPLTIAGKPHILGGGGATANVAGGGATANGATGETGGVGGGTTTSTCEAGGLSVVVGTCPAPPAPATTVAAIGNAGGAAATTVPVAVGAGAGVAPVVVVSPVATGGLQPVNTNSPGHPAGQSGSSTLSTPIILGIACGCAIAAGVIIGGAVFAVRHATIAKQNKLFRDHVKNEFSATNASGKYAPLVENAH